MSAQLYSVTIRCEYCDEVICQCGAHPKDAAASMLRSRMQKLGWKTTIKVMGGKQVQCDYCPNCRFEHGVG